MNYVLQARLKECLQTILDFETQLENATHDVSFANELSLLKNFVEKIDALTLSEEEVCRIELVTENFLLEFSDVSLTKYSGMVQ